MNVFRNIRAMRVSDRIVSQIQDMIVEGKLSVGQKLPNETELSQQLGVSRTSVREALSILEAKGVVERHKNGGTFLCRCSLEKILSVVDIPHKCDSELFSDLEEARAVIESRIGELACQRADRLDLEKIAKTLDMMQQSIIEGESGLKADLLFHQCLAMAAKNQVLAGLAQSLGTASQEIAAGMGFPSGNPEKSLEEHRAIYEAIRKHDQKMCSALLQNHFGCSRKLSRSHAASEK
jgi:GntR family transcriptional repressor for pyruvate dehydrogenase complex